MYLEKILGTGTKVSVLNLLVNNPEKSYVEKDREYADFLIGIMMDLETKGKSHWRVRWKPER